MRADALHLLGLTKKEKRVIDVLLKGIGTPVQISRKTGVSRPTTYAILDRFKKRGIVVSRIEKRRKHWELASPVVIDDAFYAAKRSLLDISEGKMEIYRQSDTAIAVYRGKPAIMQLLHHLFADHKGERFRGVQGDQVLPAWEELLGADTVNGFNRDIKKNGMIVEAILSPTYFERGVREFGPDWARDFEGRTYRVSQIGSEYFNHGAEIFLFKDVLYLVSMSEALVIEIKHSELQKMAVALITYIQDTARSIDGNEILRTLVAHADGKA